MAGWPTYSERFLEAAGAAGSWFTYVPSGERWVLKHFSLVSHAGAGAGGGLFVASYQVAYATIQVSGNDVQRPLTQVAYDGDRVQINLSSPNMYAMVSGFAFRDVGGGLGYESESITLEQLPAEWDAASWCPDG